MELFELLKIGAYIDFIVIALVIVSGYAVKRYWPRPSKLFTCAWKTLVVSTALVVVYAVIVYSSGKQDDSFPLRAFVSYTIATSLYDLILKNFRKKVKHGSNS
jgi:amino acid transporter